MPENRPTDPASAQPIPGAQPIPQEGGGQASPRTEPEREEGGPDQREDTSQNPEWHTARPDRTPYRESEPMIAPEPREQERQTE
jgi:hypothetical protein